jgi:hypothetical protein
MGKSGIPYFPLDVELDEKMELIEAEYGLTGYAVIIKLLQRIYGGHGYYIHWTYEVALLFAKRLGVGGSVVSEIIEAAVKRGMFHKKIFEKYKVLTSEGIQKRYFTAIARRKEIEVNDDILLVQVDHFCRNASIIHKNVSKNAKNADIPAQRKEKKRNKSTIILSVFLCLSLIGCGVLGYIVADQASFITSRKQIIQNYRDELDKCIPKAEFLDNKVVIVGGTSTKTYHKYGCVLLDTTNGYLAFNPGNAKANGYKPCSICCK